MTTEFERFVEREAAMGIGDVNYSFVGLAGETGECLEWHKKANLRAEKRPKDTEALASELGDVLHYLTRLGLYYGYSLNEIMTMNMVKIRDRVRARKGIHGAVVGS